MPARLGVVLALVLILAPARASAERLRLRYDPLLDGTLTGAAATLIVLNGVFEADIAPSTCKWCDRDDDGRDTLNGFDAAARDLRVENIRPIRRWGDMAIWRFLPQVAVGLLWLAASEEGEYDQGIIDALIALEATTFAAISTQVVRYLVARERPYVHFYTPEERAAERLSADANSSFFSGHASVSFAMAVSAGTISSMRRSKWAPLVWVLGLGLATLASSSRVFADLHYASDVLVGSLFGSAVGFAVPYFLHRPY
jgi:membrane-associated phospholipid phosphatase